jgi:hypothetical protein
VRSYFNQIGCAGQVKYTTHPLDGTEIKIFVFKSTHKNDYFAAANNVQKCVVSEWSMVACCV